MSKAIKPLVVCECGKEIRPTKQEAGRYLTQFRKAPYDAEVLREQGKRGGRPKKR